MTQRQRLAALIERAYREGIRDAIEHTRFHYALPTELCQAAALFPLAVERNELAEMEARKDAAYLERNQVVAALASAFPSGITRTAIPGWSDDWHGCVYIDLPTGQASWHYHDSHAHLFAHLPLYTKPWDGHTTEQKYERLAALKEHTS